MLNPHLLRKVAESDKRLFVHPRSLPLSLAPTLVFFLCEYVTTGIVYLVFSHCALIIQTCRNPFFMEELQARIATRTHGGNSYYA